MTQLTPKAAVPYAELTDAPNIQTYAQGLATMLDNAIRPTYATRTARDAANPSPTTGDACFVTADQREYVYYNGQWNNQTALVGITNVSFTTQTSFSTNVTFSIAFEFTPIVLQPNINSGSGSTGSWDSRAINITTTGFTIFNFGPSATWSSIPVGWYAL